MIYHDLPIKDGDFQFAMLVYQRVFHYKWPMKTQHEVAQSWGFSATLGDLGDKDCCESIRDLGPTPLDYPLVI